MNEPRLPLELTIDGQRRTESVDPRAPLVDALRDDFGARAPKVGCRTGDCGACTVRVDGELRKSCLLLAAAHNGAEIVTIAGLAGPDALDDVQSAFWDTNAFQCGFCVSGMLLSAEDLLERDPEPCEADIRSAISGNLCRCTGYQAIVAAIELAAERRRGQVDGPPHA